MKWVMGPRNRISGVVIWLPELIEEKMEQEIGKGGGPTSTTYSYFANFAVGLVGTEGLPGGRVNRVLKIWANSKVIYDNGVLDSSVQGITIHLGDQTTPDPLIEATEGSGNVPSHIFQCFLTFNRMALAEFGNQIPTINALVEQDYSLTVGEGLQLISERSGLLESQVDVSRVQGCLKGAVWSGPQKAADIIQIINSGYAVGIQEVGSSLIFIQRGQEDVLMLDSSLLGTREHGQDIVPLLDVTDRNDLDVPREAQVTFVSEVNDFQAGNARQPRFDHNSVGVVKINLPLTMSPEEAKAVAKRALWASEAERSPVKISLPPSWSTLRECQVISVLHDGNEELIYVQQVDRGSNFLTTVTGVFTVPDVYSQRGSAPSPPDVPGVLTTLSAETVFFAFDVPPLSNDLVNTAGLYFAVANQNSSDRWRGASLYSSSELDGEYSLRAEAPAESTLGMVVSTPGSADPWFWDENTVIEVSLINGTLSGCSDQECLTGTNRAAVQNAHGDWEIIGFKNVEQLGNGNYRLSRLLRGLRGTESAITDDIVTNKPFVLLSTRTTGFWDRGLSGIGETTFLKAPARNGSLDDYEAQEVESMGLTLRPFSPTHLTASVGVGNPDNYVTEFDYSFSASSADNSFTGPSGGFMKFEPGMWITTEGWTNSGNNGPCKILSVTGSGTKLIVDKNLVDEIPSTGVAEIHFVEGDPGDIMISWKRRSRSITTLFNPAPAQSDEMPLMFLVEVFRGGVDTPAVRTWTVSEEKVTYSQELQDIDGLPSSFRLTIRVRQLSTSVGAGLPVIGEVVK